MPPIFHESKGRPRLAVARKNGRRFRHPGNRLVAGARNYPGARSRSASAIRIGIGKVKQLHEVIFISSKQKLTQPPMGNTTTGSVSPSPRGHWYLHKY